MDPGSARWRRSRAPDAVAKFFASRVRLVRSCERLAHGARGRGHDPDFEPGQRSHIGERVLIQRIGEGHNQSLPDSHDRDQPVPLTQMVWNQSHHDRIDETFGQVEKWDVELTRKGPGEDLLGDKSLLCEKVSQTPPRGSLQLKRLFELGLSEQPVLDEDLTDGHLGDYAGLARRAGGHTNRNGRPALEAALVQTSSLHEKRPAAAPKTYYNVRSGL